MTLHEETQKETLLREAKSRKKVLVVDDEEAVVKLIQYQLKSEGYEIHTAHDGLEALEKVAEFKPDLMVLDIMMPKVDGWVVCHSVKGNVTTKNIRVIILSAKTQFMAKVKGLYILQADMYMTKPFELEELSANVASLLHIEIEANSSLPIVAI